MASPLASAESSPSSSAVDAAAAADERLPVPLPLAAASVDAAGPIAGSPPTLALSPTPAAAAPASIHAESSPSTSPQIMVQAAPTTPRIRDLVPFDGRFSSWEAFDVARRAHCEKTHALYVCRNTVPVQIANKRRKLQVPIEWKYDRKVYVCTHGYKRVSRSTGSRPRQKVRFTSCRAGFTAAIVKEEIDGRVVLCIKIVNQHLEHEDHPVSVDQWRNYSQNRAARLDHPYLAHEADLMRRIGSSRRATREHIATLSGRVCTMKDMHNIYSKLQRKDEAIRTIAVTSAPDGLAAPDVEAVLQQFVDRDVENHVSILSADDGSNEAICIASKCMKEHHRVFPELCLLDTAMCQGVPGMEGFQLYSFMAMDALGNSKPVFLAQTIGMSIPLLHRICQDFKRTHPAWSEMKLVVMDKLLPEVVDVLRVEFRTLRVLLCQFRVVSYFAAIVSQPEYEIPSIEQQERVRELLKELVFAHSERSYDDIKMLLVEELEHRADHPLLLHLEQQWEAYRRLWVSYWRLRSLEFFSFFSKGFESFWDPLRDIFEHSDRQRSSMAAAVASGVLCAPATRRAEGHPNLATCMSDMLTMTKFAEEEWSSKMLMLEMTSPVTEFSAGSALHILVNCLSSFAVGLVSTQLVSANTGVGGSVSILKGQSVLDISTPTPAPASALCDPTSLPPPLAEQAPSNEGTVVYYDRIKKKRHVMQRDCSGCDCEFYAVYQLPCQHLIWYEISYLRHKQLSMNAVGARWFLRTFQVPKLIARKESNEIEYHIM